MTTGEALYRIFELSRILEIGYPRAATRYSRDVADADELGRMVGTLDNAAALRAELLKQIAAQETPLKRWAAMLDELAKLVEQHLPSFAAKCKHLKANRLRNSIDWPAFIGECDNLRHAVADTSDELEPPGLTLYSAEQLTLVNRGTIGRAVARGEIERLSNGRIDPNSFALWHKNRAKSDAESDEHVERLFKRHGD